MGWQERSNHLIPISTPSLLLLLVASYLFPIPLPQIAENEDLRILREFAELLDASEAYVNMNAAEADPQQTHVISTVSQRFMGMKAAIIANNSPLRSFGSNLGLTVFEFSDLVDSSHSLAESQVITSEFLRLLGFQEGKTSETAQFDLVFVRIGAGEVISGFRDIDFVNNLIGALMDIANPGSEVSSRLHISVVMSYGSLSAEDEVNYRVSLPEYEYNKPELSMVVPRQSYTMKAGKIREYARRHCPMLIAQWQNAVTRKDMVESYSFEDVKKHGGILVIPADRFVHEVAFKLWKAPKYGA